MPSKKDKTIKTPRAKPKGKTAKQGGKSENKKDSREDIIKTALIKRAMGYDSTEVVEEYSEGDEGMKLVKRKVTTKSVPPDMIALKMLLEQDGAPLSQMTDEELIAEKRRLISLLQSEESGENTED